jgi:glucosamine-6-phosphate deaminase
MSFKYQLAKFLPFKDEAACAHVRAIRRDDITCHSNPDFKISVIDDKTEFYSAFALDIVTRIRAKAAAGEKFVAIFPAGPMPQYSIAAQMINKLRISCKHVHSFNMDEYADENGNSAPLDWPGSFQQAMLAKFWNAIAADLRPPMSQIHFPSTKTLPDYGRMIDYLGGADVCYGGIGWCGHIAFWEAHLADEFDGDLEVFKTLGPRVVELHPMTIMQNALHSFGGDWSWVPPKALTIGPVQILGAKYRSFWLDGDLGGGVSWQRFIGRLAAHGPITPYVPGSILQTVPGSYTFLGGVADNVEIHIL